MDRSIFMGAAVAMMLLGAGMMVLPGRIISASRDHGDTRAPTMGEISGTCLAGVFVASVSAYSLFDLVTRMPRAEFLTP